MSESIQSRFLTIEEASTSASVSAETILKYKDLGLLRAFRVNGQEQFREDEIRLVFNSRKKSPLNNLNSTSVSKNDSSVSQDSNPQDLSSQNSKSEELPTLDDILSISQNNEHVSSSKDYTETTFANEPITEFVKTKENEPQNQHLDIPSIELIELTRSLKDQLETIKEERNWLRRRVEKLEASVEREQMIVISKTETVRNLVEHRRSPKNNWSFLLPWSK